MADYHVLDRSIDSSSVNIVAHIATPSGNNVGGIPWRVIMVGEYGGSQAPMMKRKFPDELIKLAQGLIMEIPSKVVFSIPVDKNDDPIVETKAQLRSRCKKEIKGHVVAMKADITNTSSKLYMERLGTKEWRGYNGSAR